MTMRDHLEAYMRTLTNLLNRMDSQSGGASSFQAEEIRKDLEEAKAAIETGDESKMESCLQTLIDRE